MHNSFDSRWVILTLITNFLTIPFWSDVCGLPMPPGWWVKSVDWHSSLISLWSWTSQILTHHVSCESMLSTDLDQPKCQVKLWLCCHMLQSFHSGQFSITASHVPTYSKTWSEATKILQLWKVSVSVAIRSFSVEDMIIRGKHTLIQQHQPEVFSQFVAHSSTAQVVYLFPVLDLPRRAPPTMIAASVDTLAESKCHIIPPCSPSSSAHYKHRHCTTTASAGDHSRSQGTGDTWGIVCGVESVLENLWLKHEILTTHSIYMQIISNTHDVPHIGTLGG